MPKVGAANEPLLERLIYGYDGSSYRPLKCDTNGNLLALSDFAAYGTLLYQIKEQVSLPSGTVDITDDPVPAGEIWVVTNTYISYTGSGVTAIKLMLAHSGNLLNLYKQTSPVSGQGYDRQCRLVLYEGDYLVLRVANASSNDSGYLHYTGYKLTV